MKKHLLSLTALLTVLGSPFIATADSLDNPLETDGEPNDRYCLDVYHDVLANAARNGENPQDHPPRVGDLPAEPVVSNVLPYDKDCLDVYHDVVANYVRNE